MIFLEMITVAINNFDNATKALYIARAIYEGKSVDAICNEVNCDSQTVLRAQKILSEAEEDLCQQEEIDANVYAESVLKGRIMLADAIYLNALDLGFSEADAREIAYFGDLADRQGPRGN